MSNPKQLTVQDQVERMLVIAALTHVETDFVQESSQVEQGEVARLQAMFILQLFKQRARQFRNVSRMRFVERVAAPQIHG